MPAALRTTAPPARLAIRLDSCVCTADSQIVNAARRMDEARHSDAQWEARKVDMAGLSRRLDPDRLTGTW